MPKHSPCSSAWHCALGLVLGAALVSGPRRAAAAPADGGAVEVARVDAAVGAPAVGAPADPEGLAVRIVLEDTPRGREALARVRSYFAAMSRRLGIVARLEVGLDSDPQQRAVLAGWRQMVEAERARNPGLPLVMAADERNAGFIGPLLRVGLSELLAGLDDAVLLEADKLQRSYAGGAPPVAAAAGAGPAGSESLDPSTPVAGVAVGAAAGVALPPRDNPPVGLSYALALLSGVSLAALVWWCGGPRPSVAASSPGASGAATGATRRRRRRR